jgi:hypothetical protein
MTQPPDAVKWIKALYILRRLSIFLMTHIPDGSIYTWPSLQMRLCIRNIVYIRNIV